MDPRIESFKLEMAQAQKVLDNNYMCPECNSSRVAQVDSYICHCRDCDKWFCKPE